MSAILAEPSRRVPLLSPEMGRPRMAKADLRKAEEDAARQDEGRIAERVWKLSGLDLKQFAALLQKDERQVARWFTAVERPQFGAMRAVPLLRPLVTIAFGEADENAIVTTTITVKVAR